MSKPDPTWCAEDKVTSAPPRTEANTTTSAMTTGMAKPSALRDIVDVRLLVKHHRFAASSDRKAHGYEATRLLRQVVRVREVAPRHAVRQHRLGRAGRPNIGCVIASRAMGNLDRIAMPATQLAPDAGVRHGTGDDKEPPSRRFERKFRRRRERQAVVSGDRSRADGSEPRDIRAQRADGVCIGAGNSEVVDHDV